MMLSEMSRDDLTNLEKSLVAFSLSRYERPFYRRGRLLGWLLIPLAVLSVEPSLGHYERWFGDALYVVIFVWCLTAFVRVVGKLASRLNMNALPSAYGPQISETHSYLRHLLPSPATWLIFVFTLPIAILLSFGGSRRPQGTPPFISICEIEGGLCLFVSFILMIASIIVRVTTGNRSRSQALMLIGAKLGFWAMTAITIFYAAATPK